MNQINLKILLPLFLVLILPLSSKAQHARTYLKEILSALDPTYTLDNLRSIRYEGSLINTDTFNIQFFKLLPSNFKGITYNDSDSIVSIVNESYYFQYQNGNKTRSPRTGLDSDIFENLFDFNFFYAINQSIDLAKIRIIEEKDDLTKIAYKLNDEYQIIIDKDSGLITEFSCNCLQINGQNLYVRLRNYEIFEKINLPTRIEFWVNNKVFIEALHYDKIEFNKLKVEDFLFSQD